MEDRLKLLRSCLIAVAVLTLITSNATSPEAQSTTTTTATPAPGVAEGQKIGTIVKTAITTAAPAVSTILDLIWGVIKKPDSAKVSKSEVTDAGGKIQAKATSDSIVAGQQKMQDVTVISDEIGVITKFLSPAATVTPYLAVIRSKAGETSTDWIGISNAWEIAKAQIELVKNVSDEDLTKVRDPYFRDRLRAMRDANGTIVLSVNQEITQKNIGDLKTDLPTLLNIYSAMTGIGGYELEELKAELIDLGKWANGHQGVPTVPKQTPYVQLLNTSLKNK